MTNYADIVFMMIEPPARIISVHKIEDDKGYKDLLSLAKLKRLLIYNAKVVIKDGKTYASQPWIVDDNTIANVTNRPKEVSTKESPPEIRSAVAEDRLEVSPPTTDTHVCGVCGKKMSSASGLTLHMKSRHTDQDKLVVKQIVTKQTETSDEDSLRCPYCNKAMSSTSGRTLHVKGKHPESFKEYLKNLT